MHNKHRTRLRLAVGLATVTIVGVAGAVLWGANSGAGAVSEHTIPVAAEPGSAARIAIDSTLYLPETTPAPAVLLAHGFGGSKESVDEQARALAEAGLVVLAFSARGFGESAGAVGINDPDREVADAQTLVTWLSERPEVTQEAPGDPLVGVAGASYGGALALMLAGTDQRIDAVVATGTWNDLGESLFPNYAEPADTPASTSLASADYVWPGVVKRNWAGIFFGAGSSPSRAEPAAGETSICGRFSATLCPHLISASVTGVPSPELLAILSRHSPAAVAATVTAPTLLLQGQRDTLFGLDQADATARSVAGPVQVRWFNGGHDGGFEQAEGPAREFLLAQLTDTQRDADPADQTAFRFDLPGATNSEGNQRVRAMRADAYPGADNDLPAIREPIAVHGDTQQIIRPPGAVPAAVSSVPGLSFGGISLPTDLGLGLDLPGQTAVFTTDAFSAPRSIVGSPTIDLRVTTTAEPGSAVLFVKLYDVSPGGRRALPGGGVAAVRIPEDALGQPLRVTLPAIAHQVPAGNHLEIAFATTDSAYATPLAPAVFTIDAGNSPLLVPTVAATPRSRDIPLFPIVGTIGIVSAVALLAVLSRFRRRPQTIGGTSGEPPLQVSGLEKAYANGYRAVDGVSFTVPRGTILGLLGPNGAGKTTTLRMAMGLIRPDSGETRIFGERVTAGAAVLSRIGAFVEGPGLLPHLSGSDNLRLYWASTGRPTKDAHFDEVLEIAALGSAIDRPVRSYSHGMKQRLAIAQAMLGLPDLLMLDEPTNGLDPPQIRTVRDVLTNYVKPGRTVVVSSHLLAEVEQTCTHAVVMNQGKVIASGRVSDLVAAAGPIEILVDDLPAAARALRAIAGVGRIVELDGVSPRVRVDAGGVAVSVLVRALVGAGVAVGGVNGSTRLEDVFLALVHDPRSTAATDEEAR